MSCTCHTVISYDSNERAGIHHTHGTLSESPPIFTVFISLPSPIFTWRMERECQNVKCCMVADLHKAWSVCFLAPLELEVRRINLYVYVGTVPYSLGGTEATHAKSRSPGRDSIPEPPECYNTRSNRLSAIRTLKFLPTWSSRRLVIMASCCFASASNYKEINLWSITL